MDFKDSIKLLGERINKLKDQVTTEEATKNAFIMPFIKELGYDVFNPFEVVPEFTADLGIKQGEKIDYAIMKDGKPIIFIECKCHLSNLTIHNESQLFRYFHTTEAKFSILTNGLEFRFYTDLVSPNKMDEKPFFTFNITDMKSVEIDELKKFHKNYYDSDVIVNTASELKYTNEIKSIIRDELQNPSPEFVKHFAKQVYPSMVTQKVLDQFTELTKKSFSQYINEMITDRLKSALTQEKETQEAEEIIEVAPENKVITTQEELESFMIVKSILRAYIDVNRIHYRDAQSYFSVLLDDNNRKPICRFFLSDNRKQMVIIDASRNEEKLELNTLDDIYAFSEKLIAALNSYISSPVTNN